ncbi:phage major capsid protein, partial [bacterium]|nr:phage major capsid protein [bacterium]
TNDITVETPTRVPGIVYDPARAEHMRDIIPIGTCVGNAVTYPQETAYTDGSGVTAENVAYGETSMTITQQTALVESITAYATFSEIMVDDFPAFASYLNARLPAKLLVKEDDEVLNGTTTIAGLLTVATAFAAGGATVTNPNEFDALVFALNQVREDEYKCNAIVMHPRDVRNMKLTKDANENYVFPWVKVLNGKADVDGVSIFVTTAMTAGTYLVGDFKLGCQLFQRKGINLKIHDCDHDGTVNKGMKTATITERLALACYRTKAFVYDTFAASITELTV